MWRDREELLYDLLTRDAIFILNGEVYRLDGPFRSREQADAAAEELKSRLTETVVEHAA